MGVLNNVFNFVEDNSVDKKILLKRCDIITFKNNIPIIPETIISGLFQSIFIEKLLLLLTFKTLSSIASFD